VNRLVLRGFDPRQHRLDGGLTDRSQTSVVGQPELQQAAESTQVQARLQDMGHEMVVHTVITGSQALLDTVSGFAQLASQFPAEALFVVWLNPFWGSVEHESKSFEQMKAYTENKVRVSAMVKIPALKEDTYGRDLSDMLQERLTFDEALAMDSLTIMTRIEMAELAEPLFAQVSRLCSVSSRPNSGIARACA